MRRLTRSGTVTLALAVLVFFPLQHLLPRSFLFQVINGLCVSICLGIVVAYCQSVWKILWMPYRNWGGGEALIIGVFVVAIGVVGTFTDLWIYRAIGETAFTVSTSAAFFRWVIVAGTTMLLLAASADDDRIPPKAYRKAGVVVALGCALAAVLISIGVA